MPVEVHREEFRETHGAGYPLLVHAEWEAAFPGLVAGLTAAAPGADFGFSTGGAAWDVLERYGALGRQLGFGSVAAARQVHGTRVVGVSPLVVGVSPPVVGDSPATRGIGPPDDAAGHDAAGHDAAGHETFFLSPGKADGMATTGAGLLLVVTAADCVPVYLTHEASGALGLLHAGWRGASAGVLAAGVERMRVFTGAPADELHVHLGPAVCGSCYEVGAEVLEAFGRRKPRVATARDDPAAEAATTGVASHIDLRGELAAQAAGIGIPASHASTSAWCTRCSADRLHSHRAHGAEAGRMAAFLGRRRA